MVNKREISLSGQEWQQKIDQLQALLKDIRPHLIAAEGELSERLAAISAFEFKVRSRLEPLTRRLDGLDDEIKRLKKHLRKLQDDLAVVEEFSGSRLYEEWRSTEDAGAAGEGEYRYREGPLRQPRKDLSADQNQELKRLYRRLARRFHPDFALDEEDRVYRTNIMMAINAAYTAGDLERLHELLEQPAPQQREYTDRDMAEALLKELHHCERRIQEIAEELKRLDEHPSTKLMLHAQDAAREGRDLLEELAVELRERIAHRMVQRDILESEIEAFENGQHDFTDDDFADAVYDLGLEQVLMDDSDSAAAEWREKYYRNINLDDEPDEDAWDGLRTDRKKNRKKDRR